LQKSIFPISDFPFSNVSKKYGHLLIIKDSYFAIELHNWLRSDSHCWKIRYFSSFNFYFAWYV